MVDHTHHPISGPFGRCSGLCQRFRAGAIYLQSVLGLRAMGREVFLCPNSVPHGGKENPYADLASILLNIVPR